MLNSANTWWEEIMADKHWRSWLDGYDWLPTEERTEISTVHLKRWSEPNIQRAMAGGIPP